MEQTERIVFDVQLDASKVSAEMEELGKSSEKLRNDQKVLKDMFEQGQITFAQYTRNLVENKQQLKENEKNLKALSKQLTIANEDTNKYGNTLNEERRKLADMQTAYAALDKTQRESKGGRKFLDEIRKQSEAVKGMEKAMGDSRRNVGNYQEAFEKAAASVGGFGKSLKAFFLNPWVALFSAIAGAIKALVNAFKASEDRMRALDSAVAPMKAALVVVQNIFRSLAQYLTQFVVVAFQKVADGIGWVARTIDKIGAKFGKDFGLALALDEMTKKTNELTEAQQKLQDRQRRFVEQSAKWDKEVAELQAQIADKENLTAEQRIALLDKVEAIEKKKAAEELAIAKDRLAILELDASRSDNDAEANDAIAEARANVTRQEAAYAATIRQLTTQRVAIERQARAEESQMNKDAAAEEKEAQKTKADAIKLAKSQYDLQLAQGMALLGAEAEWTQAAYDLKMQYFEQLLALYEKDSADYNAVLQKKTEYDAQYTEQHKKLAEQQAKDAEQQASRERQAKTQAYQQTLRAAGSVFSSLGELAAQNAEDEKEAEKKKKAYALAGLAVDQASAIGSSVAATAAAIEGASKAAAATGPAAPITTPIFIAEMVGIVASAIASAIAGIVQAKQILSGAGSFAGGGVIDGYTSTPSRVDNTYAHVASGEMVLNAAQQKRLFDAANGAPIGGFDYAALASAMASMPAPVMDYKEFTTFQKNVATFDEFATI